MYIFTKVRQFYLEHIIGYQLEIDNQSSITVSIFGQRSFSKMFSTTYLPTLCLLVLVQMTFYFPEENFQVRAMVSQGYNHIFLINQKFKGRRSLGCNHLVSSLQNYLYKCLFCKIPLSGDT